MFSQVKILKAGHPLLRIPSKYLSKSDLETPETLECLSLLRKGLKINDLIGLSAPQIGFSLRILGYSVPKNLCKMFNLDHEILPTFLINPVIHPQGNKTTVTYESCSSVPSFNALVKRSENIIVQAWDPFGKELNFKASGILSRIIQHEIDHLDGILFTEKMITKSFRHDSYVDKYEYID